MPDDSLSDLSSGASTPSELFARFRREEPDGDSAAFDAWLLANGRQLGDARLEALIDEVIERLDDDPDGDPATFAPPPETSEREEASPSSFEVGQRVGPFVLRAFVAAGGMGQVWEAEEEELGRTVALKLLLPGRIDERALTRFAREARAGGRLQHPNLVSTYAFGWDGGLSWISQEFVPGARTLADVVHELRAEDVLPADHFRQVVEWVAALADGLHAAHEAGVVHRDVKPANVLLDTDGTPRLTDFGLARIADESALSRSGELAGTFAYMSPEQVRARRGHIDRRTDVYSLGVVLYELLTLRRPFEGDSVQQTAARILVEEPAVPSTLRAACPRDLDLICLKSIEKPRDRRYATASLFAADLRRHLANEPITARAPTRVDRLQRWTRRHPVWTTTAAIALVALVLVSALLVRRTRDARALKVLASEKAREARHADDERAALMRLSLAVDADTLEERQAELWPAHPPRIEDLRAWIAEAEALVGTLPEHRETRDRLSAELEGEPGDDRLRWWSEEIEHLIARLDGLRTSHLDPEAASTADGWGVARRLAHAERLERDLAADGAASKGWSAARLGLEADFPNLFLEPRTDLLPLGPDPESGLWEFAHLASGTVPTRDEAGRLELRDDTGIVLVLIPGETFWMGVQHDDPQRPNFDPFECPAYGRTPLRSVTLSPYLIGKYEVTQGQWLALTGENPAERPAGTEGVTLGYPVENVSWMEAARVLERHGLTLPSEAQWEHACRSGTATPFAFGTVEQASDQLNVADRTAQEAGLSAAYEGVWDRIEDGHVYAAPVGTYPPNAFGLYELHGNVAEWCLDGGTALSRLPLEPPRDPLVEPEGKRGRVYRGGSYGRPPLWARSYYHFTAPATAREPRLGLRAARSLPASR